MARGWRGGILDEDANALNAPHTRRAMEVGMPDEYGTWHTEPGVETEIDAVYRRGLKVGAELMRAAACEALEHAAHLARTEHVLVAWCAAADTVRDLSIDAVLAKGAT